MVVVAGTFLEAEASQRRVVPEMPEGGSGRVGVAGVVEVADVAGVAGVAGVAAAGAAGVAEEEAVVAAAEPGSVGERTEPWSGSDWRAILR